jgi:hypothetical protein
MRVLLLSLALLAGCESCQSDTSTPVGVKVPDQPAAGVGEPFATAAFACGRSTCQADQYCLIETPDVPRNVMPIHKTSCNPLPAACAKQGTCDCLGKNGVQGVCKFVEDGVRVLRKMPLPATPQP